MNIDYKHPLSTSIAAYLSFEALLHHMYVEWRRIRVCLFPITTTIYPPYLLYPFNLTRYMRGQIPVHMDELIAAVEREKGKKAAGLSIYLIYPILPNPSSPDI